MANIADINEQISALRAERTAIEREEFRANVLPRLREMVGQCFAFRRNSYSLPEKESDFWDVFRQVIRVVEVGSHASVVYRECYIDRDGRPTLTVGAYGASGAGDLEQYRWEPCSTAEYEANYCRVIQALEDPGEFIAGLQSY